MLTVFDVRNLTCIINVLVKMQYQERKQDEHYFCKNAKK